MRKRAGSPVTPRSALADGRLRSPRCLPHAEEPIVAIGLQAGDAVPGGLSRRRASRLFRSVSAVRLSSTASSSATLPAQSLEVRRRAVRARPVCSPAYHSDPPTGRLAGVGPRPSASIRLPFLGEGDRRPALTLAVLPLRAGTGRSAGARRPSGTAGSRPGLAAHLGIAAHQLDLSG
jgi:hypothetical protein